MDTCMCIWLSLHALYVYIHMYILNIHVHAIMPRVKVVGLPIIHLYMCMHVHEMVM